MALAYGARVAADYPAAARLYAEAEAQARPTGDRWILGLILHNHGELARRMGDYGLARRLIEEVLALHRAERSPRGIGGALAWLGIVALAEGDATTARARLAEALTVQRDAGDVWSLPERLRDLARVAQAQGRLTRAARLWSAYAAQHQTVTGAPLPVNARRTLDEAIRPLCAQLGEAAFDDAWAAGQAMTLEQAIADALAENGGT
jgi:hypothetical protein